MRKRRMSKIEREKFDAALKVGDVMLSELLFEIGRHIARHKKKIKGGCADESYRIIFFESSGRVCFEIDEWSEKRTLPVVRGVYGKSISVGIGTDKECYASAWFNQNALKNLNEQISKFLEAGRKARRMR